MVPAWAAWVACPVWGCSLLGSSLVSINTRPLASNRLLEALPRKDRLRFLASAEVVDLCASEVLTVPGQTMQHAYFPTDSFVSLAVSVGGGVGLEVGLIGNEGMLGTPVLLGVDVGTLHAVVQGAGAAIRIKTVPFRRELAASKSLQTGLNRYLYVKIADLARTAACARFHLLEARLARWLMTTGDRAQSDEFQLTHELLAHKLGVRRVGVTTAAGVLQDRKLISYSRGHIRLLDRAGLELVACDCYRAGRNMYERIFG